MSMKLKNNLKTLLAEKGYTIKVLADKTGVPRSTISNWLAGQDPRNINQLKSVSSFLGVSVDQLCFGKDVPTSSKIIDEYRDEINAGVFEVILRRTKK